MLQRFHSSVQLAFDRMTRYHCPEILIHLRPQHSKADRQVTRKSSLLLLLGEPTIVHRFIQSRKS